LKAGEGEEEEEEEEGFWRMSFGLFVIWFGRVAVLCWRLSCARGGRELLPYR